MEESAYFPLPCQIFSPVTVENPSLAVLYPWMERFRTPPPDDIGTHGSRRYRRTRRRCLDLNFSDHGYNGSHFKWELYTL